MNSLRPAVRLALILTAVCTARPAAASDEPPTRGASCNHSAGCYLNLVQWVDALGVDFSEVAALHLDADGVAASFEIADPPTTDRSAHPTAGARVSSTGSRRTRTCRTACVWSRCSSAADRRRPPTG